MRETWIRSLGWEDPFQYSGLENSKDCIVHGFTKSQTQLGDFHFHSVVFDLPTKMGPVTYTLKSFYENYGYYMQKSWK